MKKRFMILVILLVALALLILVPMGREAYAEPEPQNDGAEVGADAVYLGDAADAIDGADVTPDGSVDRVDVPPDGTLMTWAFLGTYAGAVFAAGILTQISKNIPGIRNMPTQAWSYILTFAIMILARVFTDGITVSEAVLTLLNAAMVSLAANGGYAAVVRIVKRE